MNKGLNAGFTLIELLVAVMIVGILSAVAVSSYQDYITRASRADAKAVLMEVAGWMERNYSATGSYNKDPQNGDITNALTFNANTGLLYALRRSPKDDGSTKRYDISFTPNPTATDFTVQAVPVAADAECGTLTLNSLGVQSASNGSVADCWLR
jgi:type IV pilus assembly protein PilE